MAARATAGEIVKALEDAIARGDIEVEVLGENVVVNFTPTEAKDEELRTSCRKH